MMVQRLMLPSLVLLGLLACAPKSSSGEDGGAVDSGVGDTGTEGGEGPDGGDGADGADGGDTGEPDPFADLALLFTPGEAAGFGADRYPEIVYGPPQGAGDAGSLDVLSLGREGLIVLELTDIGIVDGEGPDLLVFENPFTGWLETGRVAVSEDGETWHEWPCDAEDAAGGYPGCAGVGLVWSHPDNGIDPTDPAVAGGDAFDLADLGIERARYVRIVDSGANSYEGTSGGFDLDGVAVVNGEVL